MIRDNIYKLINRWRVKVFVTDSIIFSIIIAAIMKEFLM